jgi:Fe-S oxidoreductase
MMLIIRDLLENKLEPTEALVEHMYECLLCEGCNAVCAGMDSIPLGSLECAEIFRALRADLVEMGVAPPARLKKNTDNIAEKHNRQGATKNRGAWAEDLGLKDGGEIVIFAGCTAAYADDTSVTNLAVVLQQAHVDFGILTDEWCCGSLQEDAGIIDGFKISAQHNVEVIRKTGAKTVVVTCADCYKALNDYPGYVGELGFEVIHSSELILRLLKEGKIALNAVDLGGTATYNDPCFLARGDRPVIDEPRELLHAIPGTEWVEMEGFGRYTYCCGRPITAPASLDTYQKTGLARLGDAEVAGAKVIVTGCANCKSSLRSAARKAESDITVMDIAELAAKALAR